MKKNIYLNIFLCLVAIFCCVLFLEILLRLTESIPTYVPTVIYAVDYTHNNSHIHRDSLIPGLKIELVPNINSHWQKVDINTNSMGVRDKEYSLNKPNNTFRIIGLGDSVTFGAMIEEEDTFLNLLEEKLNNEHNYSVEIINGGVSAYNSIQEFILLKNRLIKYNPDMVILNFFQNDYDTLSIVKIAQSEEETSNPIIAFSDKEILALNLKDFSPFSSKINYYFLVHSAFYRFMNMRIYDLFSKINPDYYVPKGYLYLNGIDTIAGNKHAILSLIDYSKKKGFQLIIVIHPNLEDNDNNDNWIREVPKNQYSVHTLDLYPVYRLTNQNMSNFRVLQKDTIHPNAKGNKLIASAIFEYINKEKLMPEKIS